jgi:hypothetical protein
MYAPPRKDIQNVPAQLIEKALFGVTTLVWECKLTGETKKEEVLGSDENQLEEICANAATFGPQYVEMGDGMYIVAKWQAAPQSPPAEPVNNIPIR